MKNDQILVSIETHFRYLTTEFGFSTARSQATESYGNAFVEYQLDHAIIRISLDKGHVVVDIAPRSTARSTWFGLYTIIEFFAPAINVTAFSFPEKWDDSTEIIEKQIEHAAQLLHQYCEPILSSKFSQWKAVEEMRLKKVRKEYKDITGKDYPK